MHQSKLPRQSHWIPGGPPVLLLLSIAPAAFVGAAPALSQVCGVSDDGGVTFTTGGATATGALSLACGPNAAASNGVTAIGWGAAMGSLPGNEFNTAVGNYAGAEVDGWHNVGVGVLAGGNVVGDRNTAYGSSAGYEVTGSNNVATGPSAGRGVNGHNNVATGWEAGGNVIGTANVAIGDGAGRDVIGNGNVATGQRAGRGVDGGGNIAAGTSAGNNVTGNLNNATGYLAGSNVNGSHNLASGTQAGRDIAGSYNSAYGMTAGNTVDGVSNLALGTGAGNLVQGDDNLAVGRAAGMQVSGNRNNAIGLNAGQGVTGNRNTAVGDFAGSNVTGDDNVALGGGAGNEIAASRTISIGTGARAGHDNSVAVGAAVVTSRANQFAFGTASSTYTLAGIGSAASLAAQAGPTYFATSDAAGNLALSAYGPDSIAALDVTISETRTEARQGIAAAIAMGSAPMPSADGRTSWVANVGYFKGESAFGGSIAHRIDVFDNPFALTAGYAYGGDNSHAARVGLAGEF